MLREYFNEHPLTAVAFSLAVLVIILFVMWYDASRPNALTRRLTLSWYTDDDGKTWFSDKKSLSPPFDHNGKTAVRAYLFSCDGGKTEFVAYLERYSSDAKQAIEQAREKVLTDKTPPPPGLYERIEKNGLELKKPGDSEWADVRSPEAAAIRKVNCPAGGSLQEITP
jgi:hypothetical protein